ncbi:hypothetical protein Zmor_014106 [Zophobas morio]|uniref:Uncharacterized protein n=1 Tax=Zophobas morio TaxID=2755281 RepID=A0AA38IIY3_9CUCU|nr:hypothetical protein Zmor_014106 [Zophobas morio]
MPSNQRQWRSMGNFFFIQNRYIQPLQNVLYAEGRSTKPKILKENNITKIQIRIGKKFSSASTETAYHWVRFGREIMNPRGGIKPKILNEQQIAEIIEWVEDECDLALKQVQGKLRVSFESSGDEAPLQQCLQTRGQPDSSRNGKRG